VTKSLSALDSTRALGHALPQHHHPDSEVWVPMSDINSAPPSATSARYYPLLLALFVGSGCAALIYEIVWFQLLELVIGSSAVSLGILLGTFMGGMCLGSLLFPRLISRTYHPLRVYALLELTIGVIGLAILFAMPLVAGA